MKSLNSSLMKFFFPLALIMSGCWHNSNNIGDSNSDVHTGNFVTPSQGNVATAIQNISHKTQTQSGITNEDGNFSYKKGEFITFNIGDMKFPTVETTGEVNPFVLGGVIDATHQKVNNIARLLYSLDADFDLSNGIQIPNEASSVATEIDFDVSGVSFERDANVINLVANSGSINTELVSASSAEVHLSYKPPNAVPKTFIDIGRGESISSADWMSKINGFKNISQVTMPGTHDSAAYKSSSAAKAYVSPFVLAQSFSISDQLIGGVRLLDIRLAWNSDNSLSLHHGDFYLDQNFGGVIDTTIAFLNAHPTETVIFMINQESTSQGPTLFGNAIMNYINQNGRSNYFRYASEYTNWWPGLNDIRGKIIMLSRFGGNGLPPQFWHVGWPDNTKGYTTNPGNHTLFVQDYYNPSDMESKRTQIDAGIKWAYTDVDPLKFFINFTSYTHMVLGVSVTSLKTLAENIQPGIVNEIKGFVHSGKRGAILMDHALINDFTKHIIEMNMFSPIVWTQKKEITSGIGWKTAGSGITMGDIDNDGGQNLVSFYIDDGNSNNFAYYRVSSNIKLDGTSDSWGPSIGVPVGLGNLTQGAGITMGDIDNDGGQNLVIFYIEDPAGENKGYYRVSSNINSNGTADSWSDPINISGWFGTSTAGAGITMGDIGNNGKQNLIISFIDDPVGQNTAYYRVSSDIKSDGTVDSWTGAMSIQNIGWYSQGAGITVGDIDNDGTKNLIFSYIDAPVGQNTAHYIVSSTIKSDGTVDSWKGENIPGNTGENNEGAGITMGDIGNDGKEDLVFGFVDNPYEDNSIYYQTGFNK